MKQILLATLLLLGFYAFAQQKTRTTKRALTDDQRDSLHVANIVATRDGYYKLNYYFVKILRSPAGQSAALVAYSRSGGNTSNKEAFNDFKVNPISYKNIDYMVACLTMLKESWGEEFYILFCKEVTGEPISMIEKIDKYVFMRTDMLEKFRQRAIKKEAEAKRKAEITSKTYDLEQYDTVAYENVNKSLKQEFINCFKTMVDRKRHAFAFYGHNVLKRIKNDRCTEIEYLFACKAPIGHHYLSVEKNLLEVTGNFNSINPNELLDFSTLNQILSKIAVEQLKIEGYEVERSAVFSITIDDYACGFTKVKVKKGEIQFVGNIPDNDLVEKITEKLKEQISKPRGTYTVFYSYINVMGDTNFDVEVMKK